MVPDVPNPKQNYNLINEFITRGIVIKTNIILKRNLLNSQLELRNIVRVKGPILLDTV